jgi:hypothetical protein
LIFVSELKSHQMSMVPFAQAFQCRDLLLEHLERSISGPEALHCKIRVVALSLYKSDQR